MPMDSDNGCMFVLRRGESPRALSEKLGAEIARASDYQQSAVKLAEIPHGATLWFERLGVAVVRFPGIDLAQVLRDPRLRETFVAARRVQKSTISVGKTPLSPLSDYDEAESTWGLQVTRVATSPLTGYGVRVAVLDSALDLDHPDFRNRPNTFVRSFVAGQATRSLCVHGTAVAGIVAGPVMASSGPRYGIAGDCELFFGRVMNDGCGYDDVSLVAGLEWAIANDCRIVNLSLGRAVEPGEEPAGVLEQICCRAEAEGTMVVAAAGNGSARHQGVIEPVEEPANCTRALAVGALTTRLEVAGFSNGGLSPNGGELNIVAPGYKVHAPAAHEIEPGLHYSHFNFTSMATPFVTGIAALWLEREPHLTPAELWVRLTSTASPIGMPRDYGAGLVQAPQ